ncbi:MAG: pyridoxamine 5'-phosphate oxidase family protein [Prevotella sp.]|jgi:nitroimidazol reductase NimA-like FMN-containing flavoprotein (pyridoxamine 5'-phosphate oxidase superfamily)|nr:pyridoxamine 5'-phosphate oxidase family protein [Prevotella sp.]
MFREVRRQNRLLDNQERIEELLQSGEYGFLSVGYEENGYSYGIPLSYAYDKDTSSLYFHCATEGQKLEILTKENKVSFCIVGETEPVADQFTTLYESVIVFGKADVNVTEEEKRKGLRLLVAKYSKGFEDIGEKYMEGSWHRTFVFKLNIEHTSAKAKYR